jgi:hypothetical protein
MNYIARRDLCGWIPCSWDVYLVLFDNANWTTKHQFSVDQYNLDTSNLQICGIRQYQLQTLKSSCLYLSLILEEKLRYWNIHSHLESYAVTGSCTKGIIWGSTIPSRTQCCCFYPSEDGTENKGKCGSIQNSFFYSRAWSLYVGNVSYHAIMQLSRKKLQGALKILILSLDMKRGPKVPFSSRGSCPFQHPTSSSSMTAKADPNFSGSRSSIWSWIWVDNSFRPIGFTPKISLCRSHILHIIRYHNRRLICACFRNGGLKITNFRCNALLGLHHSRVKPKRRFSWLDTPIKSLRLQTKSRIGSTAKATD